MMIPAKLHLEPCQFIIQMRLVGKGGPEIRATVHPMYLQCLSSLEDEGI